MLRDLTEVAALAAMTAGGFLLFGPMALIVGGAVTLLALEVTDRGPSREDPVRGVRDRRNGRGARQDSSVLR